MTRRTLILVCTLILAAGALATLVIHLYFARISDEEERTTAAREQRQQPLFEVAPAPLPSGLPLLPSASVPDGGAEEPWRRAVDRPALRSLLLHHRFAELTAAFAEYQRTFEADPRYELWPLDATDTFGGDANLTPLLDAWVAASPDHFAPLLARGAHHVSLGYRQRGTRFARETPAADLQAMEASFARALPDLQHALLLCPRSIAARRQQLFVHRAHGDLVGGRAVLDAAMTSCPTCFRISVTWAYSLLPRWGGSYAALTRYVDEQRARGVLEAKVLGGFLYVDRAQEARERHDPAAALEVIGHAFDYGEHEDFYDERADVHLARKAYEEALADVERALRLRPAQPSLLAQLARVQAARRAWEPAGLALLQALRAGSGTRELRDVVVQGLIYDGAEADQRGDRERAVRLFELAGELDPGNADAARRRAWSLRQDPPAPTPNAASDDDAAFHAIVREDYRLAHDRQFDQVIRLWDGYLATHPRDARAYLERGGAHFHAGHAAEARADAERACELGSNEGCLRARQLSR